MFNFLWDDNENKSVYELLFPPFFTTYYLIEVGSETDNALPVIREGIALREGKHEDRYQSIIWIHLIAINVPDIMIDRAIDTYLFDFSVL